MSKIVWQVARLGGQAVVSFFAESDAVDFCRAKNAAWPFSPLHQVERHHLVGGRVV